MWLKGAIEHETKDAVLFVFDVNVQQDLKHVVQHWIPRNCIIKRSEFHLDIEYWFYHKMINDGIK